MYILERSQHRVPEEALKVWFSSVCVWTCVYFMFYVIYINILIFLVDCPLLCQHEKYSSQLQMGIKSTESKQQNLQEEKSKLERSERKSLTGESDQI